MSYPASRTRVISPVLALYAGPFPSTGYLYSSGNSGVNLVNQLQRVQSCTYGATVPRQFVEQYGQTAPLDQVIIDAPKVNLDFSYIVADGSNAYNLGFVTDATASAFSGLFALTSDDRNYFLEVVKDGSDAVNNTDPDSTKICYGIGNGYISSFTAEGAVGRFATESFRVEALNLAVFDGTTGGLATPAIVPASGSRVVGPTFGLPAAVSGVAGGISAVRPGDIQLSLSQPAFGADVTDIKIQSYNLSANMNRQDLLKLGSPFPFTKQFNFPMEVSLSVEAELGASVTGDLSSILCNDVNNTLVITLYAPGCPGTSKPVQVQYTLVGAKLDTQNFTTALHQDARVQLNWKAAIGNGNDQIHALLYSGSNTPYGQY